jgi:hypothetical protein
MMYFIHLIDTVDVVQVEEKYCRKLPETLQNFLMLPGMFSETSQSSPQLSEAAC